MGMLRKARVHLDYVGETGNLAQRVLGHPDAHPDSQQAGHDVSPHWMVMHLGHSPELVAELTAQAVDLAGTVGVPRGLRTLGVAGPCACLLLAMSRAKKKVDRSRIARAFDVSSLSESMRGDDPVGLAACIDYEVFEDLREAYLSCDLPEYAIELLDAAWPVATMSKDVLNLRKRDWVWTSTLDRFFAIEGYRGIRRRAARLWGRGGAGDLYELTSQFPDEAFENQGFGSFLVEWFLSRMQSLQDKPMAKKHTVDKALECSKRLVHAHAEDSAAWLYQVAMEDKQSKFMNRGGQWD